MKSKGILHSNTLKIRVTEELGYKVTKCGPRLTLIAVRDGREGEVYTPSELAAA